jgi:hypothetical protein
MSYRFNYDYYVTFPFYFLETFHSMTFQLHVHFPNCLYVVSMFVILLFSRSQVFNFLIFLIHKEMCLVLGRRNICIARKQMATLTFGFRLWRIKSEANRKEHRKLVIKISWKVSERESLPILRLVLQAWNSPM